MKQKLAGYRKEGRKRDGLKSRWNKSQNREGKASRQQFAKLRGGNNG